MFVVERDGAFQMTDHDEAFDCLEMRICDGLLSPKQARLVDDVCVTLNLERVQGQLVRLAQKSELA